MEKWLAVTILSVALALCVTTFDNDLFSVPSHSLIQYYETTDISLSPSQDILKAEYSNCLTELNAKLSSCNELLTLDSQCSCANKAITNFKQCTPNDYSPEADLIDPNGQLIKEISKLIIC